MLVYRLSEGQAVCVLIDPSSGTKRAHVKELSAERALLDTDLTFQVNEYIDVSLELPDGGSHALFANVTASNGQTLALRWLHFDPGEEGRLATLLRDYMDKHGLSGEEQVASSAVSETQAADATDSGQQKAVKRQTRKVVRPSRATTSSADSGPLVELPAEAGKSKKTRKITRPQSAAAGASEKEDEIIPFATRDETAAPRDRKNQSASAIEPFADDEAASGGRRQTRRIVKPSKTIDDDSISPFSDDGPGSGSGGRHIVIAPTEKFNKLRSIDETPAEGHSVPLDKKKKKKSSSSRSSRRMRVVGEDGKIDVGATIRSRAKTVNASELAARHSKVRVLNMATIKELIQEAVGEAVKRLGSVIDEAERKRLMTEAEEEFNERLKAFNAEKQGWEAQQKTLEGQLKKAQGLLEEEREKAISSDQFTVSAAGMEDLEKRMDRLINRAVKVNGVNDALADELQNMVTHLLDTERDRIAEQAREAQSEAIALLEKKVQRLAGNLDSAEKERDLHMRRAAALEESGGGLRNVMTAGLDAEDPDKERKLALLKTIFDENKAMRKHMSDSGMQLPKPQVKPKPKPQVDPERAAQATAEVPDEHEPVAEVEESLGAEEETFFGGGDPDDEIWTPGTPISSEPALAEAEASDIKKMTGFKDFGPPPLERSSKGKEKEAAVAVEATSESEGEDAAASDYFGGGDPDDEIWEPGTKISSEPEWDEEGHSDIKKMTNFKQFEPPPLERGSKD